MSGNTVYRDGVGAVGGDQLNSFPQICLNVASARAFTGVANMSIVLLGYNSQGDGGQGVFYWNGVTIDPDDGGVTIIRPQGLVAGAWVRIAAWVQAPTGTSAGIFINIKGPPFNAVGNGITDDSSAINAALAVAAVSGGTVYVGPLRCAVNSSISIPNDVTLLGDYGSGLITTNNFYPLPSQLILGSGVTINMASRSAIVGLIVSRSGLPMPATDHASAAALIAAFNGTGITGAGSDILMRDLLVIGHTLGVSASWSDPIVQQGGRCNFQRVRGDCTNGIQCSNSFDISRLTDCHFWPFLTVSVPGITSVDLTRSGIAFDSENNDWDQYKGCFAYGYGKNYRVNNSSSITYVSCASDGPGSPNTYGWEIAGDGGSGRTSSSVDLSGCVGNSAPTILYINPGQPSDARFVPTTVRTRGCRFAAQNLCVHVVRGSYVSAGDEFDSGGGTGIPGNVGGIYAESGTSGAILGSTFQNTAGNGYGFADSPTEANWEILATRFTGSTQGVPSVTNQLTRPLNVTTLNAANEVVSGAISSGVLQAVSSTTASGGFRIAVAGVGTDEEIWDFIVNGTNLAGRAVNDAFSAANNWLMVQRVGYTIGSLSLSANVIGLSSPSVSIGNAGGAVGFLGTPPVSRPNVTGSWGGNAAGQALAAALGNLGLITNSTTA